MTLAGRLIDASGTMSGEAKGSMSNLRDCFNLVILCTMPPHCSTKASIEPWSQSSQRAAKRKREEKENLIQTVSVVKGVEEISGPDECEGTPPKRTRVSPALGDE